MHLRILSHLRLARAPRQESGSTCVRFVPLGKPTSRRPQPFKTLTRQYQTWPRHPVGYSDYQLTQSMCWIRSTPSITIMQYTDNGMVYIVSTGEVPGIHDEGVRVVRS